MSFIDTLFAPRGLGADFDRRDADGDAREAEARAAARRRRRVENEVAVFDAYRRFGIR